MRAQGSRERRGDPWAAQPGGGAGNRIHRTSTRGNVAAAPLGRFGGEQPCVTEFRSAIRLKVRRDQRPMQPRNRVAQLARVPSRELQTPASRLHTRRAARAAENHLALRGDQSWCGKGPSWRPLRRVEGFARSFAALLSVDPWVSWASCARGWGGGCAKSKKAQKTALFSPALSRVVDFGRLCDACFRHVS